MIPLILIAAQSSVADRMFDRCLAAHKQMEKGVAQIAYSGRSGRLNFTVDWSRPNEVCLKVAQEARSGMAATNRSFAVRSDQFTAFEQATNKFLIRKAEGADLEARLRSPMGGLDEVVGFLISPKGTYLERFRMASPWVRKGDNDLSFVSKERKSSLSIGFDKFGRLTRLEARLNGAVESWKLSYPSRAVVSTLEIPKGAVRADSFRDQKAYPKFESTSAEAVIKASSFAYDRLKLVSYSVDGFRVVTGAGRYRQDQGDNKWEYARDRLLILNTRTKTAYSGSCKFSAIPTVLTRLAIETEPLLKNLLQGANPIRYLMGEQFVARSAGTLILDGVSCTLIEARAPGTNVELVIRKEDKLLRSVSIKTVDPRGNVLYANERVFRYEPPLGRLVIPEGYKTVGLPTKS